MKTVTTTSGISKVYGNITVDGVRSGLKEDRLSAQLRQTITTTYPSKKADNSMTDSLFDAADFGFNGGQTNEAIRMAWIDVPLSATSEQVEAMLAKLPEATIVKHISCNVEDVLTDEQKYAVREGIRTLADFKASLIIKKNEGGKLVEALTPNGKAQYQQHFFKKEYAEDVDFRTTEEKVINQSVKEEGVPARKNGKALTNLKDLVSVN